MPNSGGLSFGLRERRGAVHRGGLNDLERVEAGFLQHLQLVHVAETVGLIDEARIGSGRDAATHLLVVVEQLEPHLVEVPPCDLVFGRPVVPVRAVVGAAGRVERHQRRQRVLVVPVGVTELHQIASGRVDRQRRIEHRAELEVLGEVGLPLRRARLMDLVPQPRDLAEPPLLVGRIHVHRPGLDDVVLQAATRSDRRSA